MNRGKRIDRIYIKVIQLLIERPEPLSTKEILEALARDGILKRSEGDKKSLIRALNRLEELGLIVSEGGRGRGGKRWELTPQAEEMFSQINDEDGIGLLVLLALLPDEYRELPIFNSVERIALSISKRLGEKRVKDLKERFFYQKPYTMRFAPISDSKLAEIVKAIIEERPVEVIRKDLPIDQLFKESPPGTSNLRKIYPISLFYYDGNFYVGAIRRHGNGWRYRTYLLGSLSLYGVPYESFPRDREFVKLVEKKRKTGMDFPEPKPFLFKVVLSEIGGRELKIEGALAFTTQIEAKKRSDGTFEVLLVGYAEPRFCNEFLQKDFIEIISLTEKEFERIDHELIKEMFKRRGVNLPLPPRSFKQNTENFKKFLKYLRALTSKKDNAVELALKNLN